MVNALTNLAVLMQIQGDNHGAMSNLQSATQIMRENNRTNITAYTNMLESIMEMYFLMGNYQ